MQRRHRTTRPIDMPRAWLREALKHLALLVWRKRKPANVLGASAQLV
jgi:DNA-directed RNA polymerase specialized sigma24 family protein